MNSPCPHLGDRIWLGAACRPDGAPPCWFRILAVTRLSHGWAVLRGYPIHPAGPGPPIGPVQAAVVFLPRAGTCVHGY